MSRVKLQIDGYYIEAEEEQSVLEAALQAGIYIPHLCYHPDLTPQGGCKLCAVEIEGEDRVVQSCETIVREGMKVCTKTKNVEQLRIMALELMLASHPDDCTSCDKYLNCELQALMQYLGVAKSRVRTIEKENTRIAVSDTLIKKEMQRCILCGRCVRACEELRGVKALAFNKKDGETYVHTVGDLPLSETDCRFCGACVEVCPTGAIQDVKGIFSKNTPKQLALVPCQDTCPAHTDIPMYVRLVEQGKYSKAAAVIREKLTFPHSLGYICNHACESKCKRNHVNEAISIRELKRFAIENDKEEIWKAKRKIEPKKDKRVGVIGGGPAGMSAAYYLCKKGYAVTVYEKQPMAGGMLSYGIPKYRLPQEIVNHEIELLTEVGIDLQLNKKIHTIDELKSEGYDALLVAVGTTKGKRPQGYDKAWRNVMDAVDFCRLACENNLPSLGDTVTVYGGGNVAFDCARTAKRLGVSHVRIVCMEARKDMLADLEEIRCALEEGIEIYNQKCILEFEEINQTLERLKLSDIRGFSFTPQGLVVDQIEDSEQFVDTDTFILATGQQPDLTQGFGIELFRGTFVKTSDKLKTSCEGVFAAGDAVYGTKSVVEAIASGREAAMIIDKYLGGDGDIEESLYDKEVPNPLIGTIENFANLNRIKHISQGCEACSEASRCLQCDLRLQIESVKYWVDPYFKKVKEVTP